MRPFAVRVRVVRFRNTNAKLRHFLELLAARFCDATGLSPAAIGKKSINDNTFFARLAKGDSSFTIRTYDRVVGWLWDKWPDDVEWPADIERPVAAEAVPA